jgi:hypothetical protein
LLDALHFGPLNAFALLLVAHSTLLLRSLRGSFNSLPCKLQIFLLPTPFALLFTPLRIRNTRVRGVSCRRVC